MAKSIFEQLDGTYERQGEFSDAFSFREFLLNDVCSLDRGDVRST